MKEIRVYRYTTKYVELPEDKCRFVYATIDSDGNITNTSWYNLDWVQSVSKLSLMLDELKEALEKPVIQHNYQLDEYYECAN